MNKIERLTQQLQERILIIDGAMGSLIQTYQLDEAGYRGERFANHPQDIKGNNEALVLVRPDIIHAIHTAYLEACRAPSPKAHYAWSHPAIYFAGKATDWYFLQTSSESVAYPVFKRKYTDICERIRAGEKLEIHAETSLEHNRAAPLNKQENLKKLQALRAALDL